MNLILLFDQDFIEGSSNRVCLTDRRFQHIQQIHKPQPGDELTVGKLNGLMGSGKVIDLNDHSVTLDVELNIPPPPPLPLTLLLALPRPQMLKRTLQTISTMGVKQLYLLQTQKVEKSFWHTPQLHEENLLQHLYLGLEQARDTMLPQVHFRQRFKPFVEDELTSLIAGSQALVAHPGDYPACPRALHHQVTLAIGPEGGFNGHEITLLEDKGFQPVQLGDRILRVETAVPVLLAKLFD